MKVSKGGATESRMPLRRQAPIIPKTLPKKKLITVAKPANKIVHINPVEITSVTWAGKKLIEMPNSPRLKLLK